MKIPTNNREWLNAIQANRRDMARAFDENDRDEMNRLRKEYDQLMASKPTKASR